MIYKKFVKIFLSNFEKKKFLFLVGFGNDKGIHISSLDQTLVITWKIIGDGLWSNNIDGDKS